MDKILFGVMAGLLIMVIAAIVGVLGAIPTYYLWNWLMPQIFGLKVITFWQAWGLFFLCSILFKGNGSNSSSKSD